MLRAERISFDYRLGATAFSLKDVTLAIPPGSLTGLLGPNGSGKTTLLKLLCGVLRPTSGSVMLGDRPLASFTRRELARRVAIVPQETHPAFDYTVMEMVLMGRHPHLGTLELEGPQDFAIAREALNVTGTASMWNGNYMTLSGGEKQRVIIASGLAQAGELMLLDEPTSSLDLAYQVETSALLRRLNRERGTTLVVSTHDLNFAAGLCGRIVLLRDGRVLADGRPEETLTSDGIWRTYGIEADVRFHEAAGHVTVVPLARYH